MPTNRAAYLEAQNSRLTVSEAPYVEPKENEILIKTAAVAINPVDYMMQDTGELVEKWPVILGCDVAGTIIMVGPGVKDFNVDDRVIAHSLSLGNKRQETSTFQEYVIALLPVVARLPDSISFEQGVVLPLGLNTAVAGLFQNEFLALEMPPTSAGSGKTILVWGGSSSVGSNAIQLANAAGYETFTVASKRNHEYCKSLGAKAVFDQSDSNLVQDIVSALKGKDFVGVFDTISKEQTIQTICEIIDQSNGRKFIALTLPGTEKYATKDVVAKAVFATTPAENETGPQIWNKFLPSALKDGSFLPKPDPVISGNGLDALQNAIDEYKKGVSGRKLVVTI